VRELPRFRRHRLVQRVYPREVLDRLLLLWAHRQELLDALDRLPQVLSHNDAFRRNLFLKSERLLAVDWAFLGPGPVGAELATSSRRRSRHIRAVLTTRAGVARKINRASASQHPQRSATGPGAFGWSCRRCSMRPLSLASSSSSAFPSTKCWSSGPPSASSRPDSPTTRSPSSPRSTYERARDLLPRVEWSSSAVVCDDLGAVPQADRRPGRFPAVRLSHLEADELPNSGDPQGIGSPAAGQGGRPAGGR